MCAIVLPIMPITCLRTYYGSNTNYDHNMQGYGQSEKIFEYLLRPFGEGHHIFADRYYTTYNLVMYLISRKFFYTGTLMANRKGFPPEIYEPMKHLESKYARSDTGILACA